MKGSSRKRNGAAASASASAVASAAGGGGRRKRRAAAAAVKEEGDDAEDDAGVNRSETTRTMKKKRKRVCISETDATRILMRYSAATVMALLREVAKCNTSNVDWISMAQKSTTGITNAREYQALWRHLAYRTEMTDTYGDDAEPSDNDSDLDCEILPAPPANSEELKAVVRWVEADLQQIGLGRKRKGVKQGKSKSKNSKLSKTASQAKNSGSPRNGSVKKVLKPPRENAEDSAMVSSPSRKSSKPKLDVDPESSRAAPGQTERKKRKFWSSQEDQELISAVEAHGEGNWTTLLKGSFTHERTAAQLSQRWALIKKRRETKVPTKGSPTCEADGGGNAVEHAEDPSPPVEPSSNPVDNSTAAVANGSARADGVAEVQSNPESPGEKMNGAQSPKDINSDATPVPDSKEGIAKPGVLSSEKLPIKEESIVQPPIPANGVSPNASDSVNPEQNIGQSMPSGQGQNGVKIEKPCSPEVDVSPPPDPPALVATAAQIASSSAVGASTTTCTKNANRNNGGSSSVGKGNSVKSKAGPGPTVRAAAVAAGAKIAPASAAASVLKAAHSGNVVHIRANGVSITTSSFSGQPGMANSTAGANVHYIRTGAGIPSPAAQVGAANGHPSTKNQSVKSGPAHQTNVSIVSPLVPSTVKAEAPEAS